MAWRDGTPVQVTSTSLLPVNNAILDDESTISEVLLGNSWNSNDDSFADNNSSAAVGRNSDLAMKWSRNLINLYGLVFLNAFSVGLYVPSIPELLLNACDGDLSRATLLQAIISSLVG